MIYFEGFIEEDTTERLVILPERFKSRNNWLELHANASDLGMDLGALPNGFDCPIAGDWNKRFDCYRVSHDGTKTYRNDMWQKYSASIIIYNR